MNQNIIRDLTDAIQRGEVPMHLVLEWEHHGLSVWEASMEPTDMLELVSCVDPRAATRAACACARTVLHHIPPDEERPLKAIETTERWVLGEATEQECMEAAWEADESSRHVNLNHQFYAAKSATKAFGDAGLSVLYAAYATMSDAAVFTSPTRGWRKVYYELANVIRQIADCPTAPQLVGRFAVDGCARSPK